MIDVKTIAFRHDAWGQFCLVPPGADAIVVTPVRCFPLSRPDQCISLVDKSGHEVLLIDSTQELNPPARSALELALQQISFSPRVLRIVKASALWPPFKWTVETDRGPTDISIDDEDSLRRLGAHSVIINDSQGIRFQIDDYRTLDRASRSLLLRHL